MAEVLPAGTPTWVDLATTDLDAARRFYKELFGWTSDEPAGPEFGGYAMFRSNGKLVAGSGPVMGSDGQPGWNTYVRSNDAGATTQKVRDAGGEVVAEPMTIGDSGTMAMFRDPTGAYVGIWQNGLHAGAELFNEPVSLTWNELGTRDVETAKRFYTAVFGWGAEGDDYVEWQLDGKRIGGCVNLDQLGLPAKVPANWLSYFAVADVDDAVRRLEALGGTVNVPARDIPEMGRFAVVADPQGGVFAVFAS